MFQVFFSLENIKQNIFDFGCKSVLRVYLLCLYGITQEPFEAVLKTPYGSKKTLLKIKHIHRNYSEVRKYFATDARRLHSEIRTDKIGDDCNRNA